MNYSKGIEKYSNEQRDIISDLRRNLVYLEGEFSKLQDSLRFNISRKDRFNIERESRKLKEKIDETSFEINRHSDLLSNFGMIASKLEEYFLDGQENFEASKNNVTRHRFDIGVKRGSAILELNDFLLYHHGLLFNDLCREKKSMPFRPRVVHPLLPAIDFQFRSEFEALTNWWVDEGQDGIFALIGLGGSGKTALVHKFISQLPGTESIRNEEKINTLPTPDLLFIWSFYDEPSSQSFLEGLFDYLISYLKMLKKKIDGSVSLNEDIDLTSILAYLERWERRASVAFSPNEIVYQLQDFFDNNPDLRVLLVLDGLERIQEDRAGYILGELQDLPLRQMLRRLAGGLGYARAIITSRYPIADLVNWEAKGYKELNIDKLPRESAISLLRSHGVRGSETTLDQLIDEFGSHALTLDHLAKIITTYFNGDPRSVKALLPLETIEGEVQTELQGRRLARIFRFYEERLPKVELELLKIISCFRFPIDRDTLGRLLTKKQVKQRLGHIDFRKLNVLYRLIDRKLVYEYRADNNERFTTHPAVRDFFYRQLSYAETIHQDVTVVLSRRVPETIITSDNQILDLLEELIYHSIHSGDNKNAFSIFVNKLGGYEEIGEKRCAYQRGEDILQLFTPRGQVAPGTPRGLDNEQLSEYYLQRSLFASELGNLSLAISSLKAHMRRRNNYKEEPVLDDSLLQLFNYHILSGNLKSAQILLYGERDSLVDKLSKWNKDKIKQLNSSKSGDSHLLLHIKNFSKISNEIHLKLESCRILIDSLLGERLEVVEDYKKSIFAPESFYWTRFSNLWQISIYMRQTPENIANAIIQESESIQSLQWNKHASRWRMQLAHAYIIRKNWHKAAEQLDACLRWGIRTANQEICAMAHFGIAQLHLLQGSFADAETAIKAGLLITEECTFKLHEIEFLNLQAELRLSQSNIKEAIYLAQRALHLAEEPSRMFIWGMADALRICSKAYLTSRDFDSAKHFIKRSLDIHERIGHHKAQNISRLHEKVELNLLNSEENIFELNSSDNNDIITISCFISHANTDQLFARQLHSDLQKHGIRCWFALEDMKIGDKILMRIDSSIRTCDKLLLILSDVSIKSEWVEMEVEAALEKERQQSSIVLLPITLDDAIYETEQAWAATIRRSRHIGDFRSWRERETYQKAFEHLLLDLKAESRKNKVWY